MSTSTLGLIPAPYRILFTWIDGPIALLGAYIHLFAWQGPFREHFPQLRHIKDLEPLNAVMNPIGGAMIFQALIQLALLPSTNDQKTWDVVQLGLVLNDVTILYSLFEILRLQGKRSVADASGSGAFYGLVMTGVRTIARVVFLARVGF